MIAIIDKDRVVMAYSPNFALNGSKCLSLSPKDLLEKDNLLIWKLKGVKNGIMCGYNQIRENDLMKYGKPLVKGGEITLKRIVKEIQPVMREKFKENGFKENENEFENDYLIAQGNRLYCVTFELVHEYETFATFGVVDQEAVGAILVEFKTLSVEEKLHKIAEFTEETEGLPMFPLVVMDTKTRRLKIIQR